MEQPSARESRRQILGGLVLGAGFGAATSLSNGLVSSESAASLARVPSLILDAGWAWAAIAVAAGWAAGTPRRGAAAGALSLVAGTAVYYGVDAVLRDDSFRSYGPEIVRWWLAGILFGPLLGGIGAAARRPGFTGLACQLAVPAGAILQLIVDPPGPPAVVEPPPPAAWARAIVAAGATLSAAALLLRFAVARRRRRA